MEKLVIEGGKVLKGEVQISGSKNAALPILAATLLTDEPCVINNVPRLRDCVTMVKLLKSLGKSVDFDKNRVRISQKGALINHADYKLVSTMRGSFCVLGPLLARVKSAKVSLPGGCVIGVRPVNLHLKGLKALGAKIDVEEGFVKAKARILRGNYIYLGGHFGSSVLATANVMMAAVVAKGETIIDSAACEPELVDLANFLVKMGAKIEGQGSPRITVQGVKKLRGIMYDIGPDRIEAGTYMIMAAATRSHIKLLNVRYSHLMALADHLTQAGLEVKPLNRVDIDVRYRKALKPVGVTTYPYPGFPTDLQAQYMALMAITPGISVISEKVFPDRFMHVAELNRFGADIRREGNISVVHGVNRLYGAPVMASDLRASAALVIAGLAAKGKTEIHRIYHLERGYEAMDQKLMKLKATVYRQKD